MKQLPDRGDGFLRRHGARFMHRCIAQILDDPGFRDDRIADEPSEGWFMNACRERGLEWVSKLAVTRVEPADRYFERKPGVKARGTRIGQRQVLRVRGMREYLGEFGGEEGKLRHAALPDYRELTLCVLGSQLSIEGAMLERGEESLEFREVGAVGEL